MQIYALKIFSSNDTRDVGLDIIEDKFINGLNKALQKRLRLVLTMQADEYKLAEFNELIKIASR